MGDAIGLAIGAACLLFAIGIFVYCYRNDVLALLPMAVILTVAGILNVGVALL